MGLSGSISENLIKTSWKRCKPLLNPQTRPAMKRVSPDNLLRMHASSFDLISIARPIMEDMHQFVEGSNTIFLLTNNAGYVLVTLGDDSMISRAKEFDIEVGTLLSEGVIGTNAFGLALTERLPVSVIGSDHFLEHFHSIAEAAAPIFDPIGRPLGTLGAIMTVQKYHPHTLGLVTAGTRAIEAQWQSDELLETQNKSLAELNAILETISDGIIVWNAQGVIVHANHAATTILGTPISDLVGKPLEDNFPLPSIIQEAIEEGNALTGKEVNFDLSEKSVNCIASLRYILSRQQLNWVVLSLRRVDEIRQLVQQQAGAQVSVSIDDFVGESKSIRRLRQLAYTIAPTRVSVLIRGEAGTGKDYLARAFHNTGLQRVNPFIIFNCASVPSELMLPELIGYDGSPPNSGARPSKFEIANRGTLFFQHIEALSLETQAVLLNALELRLIHRLGSSRPVEIDVRIVASTADNLEKLVAQGSFRGDLYYRLSPFEIRLPALRDRRGDIPYIIEKILVRLEKIHNQAIKLAPGLLETLQRYPWPGNIRELEAVLERASLMALVNGLITPTHLPEYIRNPVQTHYRNLEPIPVQTLEEMEREAIIKVARACHGNVTQMALLLGIGRTTLWRKLKNLSISPSEFRKRDLSRIVSE